MLTCRASQYGKECVFELLVPARSICGFAVLLCVLVVQSGLLFAVFFFSVQGRSALRVLLPCVDYKSPTEPFSFSFLSFTPLLQLSVSTFLHVLSVAVPEQILEPTPPKLTLPVCTDQYRQKREVKKL